MNDLRYAFRMLFKSRGLSAIAILALALGIGATTAIFGVVYAFLLRPLPYARPEELVAIQSRHAKTGADLGVGFLDFRDWKEQSRSFADLAYFNLRWNGNLQLPNGSTETLKTTFTTWNLFHLLGIEPILGRNFTAADDEPKAARVVLISHRLWQQAFGGEPSVLGRQIQLDGGTRTIVGVMPNEFRFPSQSDIWVPMTPHFARMDDRAWRPDQAIGRLRPNEKLAQARAEMNLIAARIAQAHPDTNHDVNVAIVPLRAQLTGEVRFSLFLLWAACGGVLLIACVNVSQLLLARATARRHEMAVRSALGASRARLARQLLVESAVLAGLGSAAGILLSFWLVDLIAKLIPVELPFWIKLDVNPIVIAFTVAISFFTGLFSGSLPAWSATRVNAAVSLKTAGGRVGGTAADSRTRDVLTIVQVAVSIVLLVGTGLLVRSMLRLTNVDPGFVARDVLLFEVNPTYRDDEPARVRIDRFERLLARISEIPGLETAAANNSPPFIAQRPWNRTQITGEGQSLGEQQLNPVVNFQTVSSDYFRALRIPLLQGRAFDARDNLAAPKVCLLSERLARRIWPNDKAVGRRLHFGSLTSSDEGWMTVVGVVKDVRHQALDAQAGPDLYTPALQLAWKQMHFLVRMRHGWAASPLGLLPAVQREVAAIAPDVGIFNAASFEEIVADSLWQARLRSWLLGFFSAVALLLAASGLYGAIAYGVTQRTREIGIRIALGATRAAILRLVLGGGLRAVGAGILLGTLGAIFLARILRASLYGVQPNDLTSYFAAVLLLALITLIACWLPARRASRVNPTEALRYD